MSNLYAWHWKLGPFDSAASGPDWFLAGLLAFFALLIIFYALLWWQNR